MKRNAPYSFGSFLAILSFAMPTGVVNAKTIPASDALFLGSVLEETWDVRHAAEGGYIECMMPLSDVDLTVVLEKGGSIMLNFDPGVYAFDQVATAGPVWMAEVDGASVSGLITIGPSVRSVSTSELRPGAHRVRFVQVGNLSGSHRWEAHDPQLSRVTGVTLPDGARLEKSQRPVAWFLPIADSIGEGAVDMNTTGTTWRAPGSAYTNANFAWPAVMARLMHKSIAGYLISGIGAS